MARQDETRQDGGGKVAVYARVDAAALAVLDKMAEERRPAATRSQMIDLAVQEFVERHSKARKAKDN